jgi:hypothetical protein
MNSHSIGICIDVESSSSTDRAEEYAIPTAPQRAVPRTYHSVPHKSGNGPDVIELDNLQWGETLNGPAESIAIAPGLQTPKSEWETPILPNDLEMSRPPTPGHENQADGVEVLQSFSNPPINRYRLLSLCVLWFGGGLADSAPGAILPYIEK